MSKHADSDCPYCHGAGMVVEQGRLYGDPAIHTPCDCYDVDAAAREEAESFARHCAANREADDAGSKILMESDDND